MVFVADTFNEHQGIICDLDGTLVDTAEGILASLSHAFAGNGGDICGDAQKLCIGPSLDEVVRAALPDAAPETVAEVIKAFKRHYDSTGFRKSVLFDGIREMLESATGRGLRVCVLTNKRYVPTMQILSHLAIDQYIAAVAAIDSPQFMVANRYASKTERAVLLVAAEQFGNSILVGDSEDDLFAAEKIGARFLLAGWGYGVSEVVERRPDVIALQNVGQLIAAIDQF